MTMRHGALVLATVATLTALCLSTLAAWQRGGSMPERVVWVAMGVVLVASAHLLPDVLRGTPLPVRLTGYLLWGACMVTACYGHVTFVLLAQQHAGEARAASVTVPAVGSATRSLGAVMAERARVTRQVAIARTQRCSRDCALLDGRLVTLAARLDALDAEGADIRRQEKQDDRLAAQRDALRADPVTSRLAALLGTGGSRVDLLSGVLFALVLEGVACLLWTVALRPSPHPVSPVPADAAAGLVTQAAGLIQVAPSPVTRRRPRHAAARVTGVVPPPVTQRTPAHAEATGSHTPRDDPVTSLPPAADCDDDVARLAADVAAGMVRPTVADIRRHLGCAQAKASALRRQLVERNTTA